MRDLAISWVDLFLKGGHLDRRGLLSARDKSDSVRLSPSGFWRSSSMSPLDQQPTSRTRLRTCVLLCSVVGGSNTAFAKQLHNEKHHVSAMCILVKP